MARKNAKKQRVEADTSLVESAGQTGPESAGQSGDTQGLSGRAEATSESVRELAEEGQYFEAGVVSGIENAPDADESEIKTTEVPVDDVPQEYLDRDRDDRG